MTPYEQGFIEKCAQLGIDYQEFIKEAESREQEIPAYAKGFLVKCAEAGVDPVELIKFADWGDWVRNIGNTIGGGLDTAQTAVGQGLNWLGNEYGEAKNWLRNAASTAGNVAQGLYGAGKHFYGTVVPNLANRAYNAVGNAANEALIGAQAYGNEALRAGHNLYNQARKGVMDVQKGYQNIKGDIYRGAVML